MNDSPEMAAVHYDALKEQWDRFHDHYVRLRDFDTRYSHHNDEWVVVADGVYRTRPGVGYSVFTHNPLDTAVRHQNETLELVESNPRGAWNGPKGGEPKAVHLVDAVCSAIKSIERRMEMLQEGLRYWDKRRGDCE